MGVPSFAPRPQCVESLVSIWSRPQFVDKTSRLADERDLGHYAIIAIASEGLVSRPLNSLKQGRVTVVVGARIASPV